jgi:hypothetical protein
MWDPENKAALLKCIVGRRNIRRNKEERDSVCTTHVAASELQVPC